MGKKKIFNDPVYGFISYPYDILYDLIDHPYFQRLRRISQMGLSHYVYPGALHTRFHHALGALHLMIRAINTLKEKGVNITDDESEAVCIAILLHDIGHGPFSHALEKKIIPYHHEEISMMFMEELNIQFNGQLELAIQIFKNNYSKKFLHQLVSGQLDMDRMDYLNRDSFFTGVAEGVIGYDRIIKMLNVKDDEIVVEEKGIYSIEKFLMARRLMYWQVYLHKTSLAAEQMLITFIDELFNECKKGKKSNITQRLLDLLELNQKNDVQKSDLLQSYAVVDDIDIMMTLKQNTNSKNPVLKLIADSLLKRKIFHVYLRSEIFTPQEVKTIVNNTMQKFELSEDISKKLVICGSESNLEYNFDINEIKILMKDGKSLPLSRVSNYIINKERQLKHYLCFPRS